MDLLAATPGVVRVARSLVLAAVAACAGASHDGDRDTDGAPADTLVVDEGVDTYAPDSAPVLPGGPVETDDWPPDADHDGFDLLHDCDDGNPAVHPGAAEVWYDDVDEDCDGASDWDQDRDGHDLPSASRPGDDCDDRSWRVHAGATESCDQLDDDCDGLVDEDDPDMLADALAARGAVWGEDADGDDYVDPDSLVVSCLGTPPGLVPLAGATDCDDDDPHVHPAAAIAEPDLCARDVDGDGWADDDPGAGLDAGRDCDDADPTRHPGAHDDPYDGIDSDCDDVEFDADRDGHGIVGHGDDCDDLDAAIHPGAVEVCDDEDDDCDHLTDSEDPDLRGASYAPDDDDDGDPAAGPVSQACRPALGWASTTRPVDCDDHDPATHAGAWDEPYDHVDGDCVGGDLDDVDHDGARSVAVPGGTDCDDDDATRHPGAPEVCDGVDDDCDDLVDDADPDVVAIDLYVDADGDGQSAGGAPIRLGGCGTAPGYTVDGVHVDCDDLDATRFAGAPEVCHDGVDQACRPGSDDDCDGDGASPLQGDCDDADPRVGPHVVDGCNGADDDCDHSIDEDGAGTVWRIDLDGDGDPAALTSVAGCTSPGPAWSATTSRHVDCDDDDPAASWAVLPHERPTPRCLVDADGDGWAAVRPRIDASSGYDCDDDDPATHPRAVDVGGDQRDQDCDGDDD